MPALDSISGFLDSSATLGMTWERGCGPITVLPHPPILQQVQDERMGGFQDVADYGAATVSRLGGRRGLAGCRRYPILVVAQTPDVGFAVQQVTEAGQVVGIPV